jgi:hypothetical protein
MRGITLDYSKVHFESNKGGESHLNRDYITMLPKAIVGLSRRDTREFIGISNPQLTRDTWVCNQMLSDIPYWDYSGYARGYSRKAIEILLIFRELVNLYGRKTAISNIRNEVIKHYEQRQTSCQSSQKSVAV